MNDRLSTKLIIPPLRPRQVARARLIDRLDEALRNPLVLLSAPPGSGKTSLLSAWLKQVAGQARIGWVTLDSEDNDPLRFWGYVAAAFPALEAAGDLTALLTSLEAVPVFVRAWINALMDLPGPLVLVLDDYHLIEAQSVHTSLLYLLEHIPAHLHIVISSRTDPPLPLGRWRVRGQLVEIRSAHLRFTQAEAAAFLEQQIAVTLTPEQVAELEQRTEGWAAGLQVVALSLKDQPAEELDRRIRTFSGRHHFVLDYLTDEVFNHQPRAVQDFLLVTSILKRLSAPLCNALLSAAGSEGEGAQAMLAALERDNLFIIALDEERNWYRYHHLFGELLQARLREARSAESIAHLYRRAAEWHHAQGGVSEAVSYALAARDEDLAADLLDEAVRRADVWSQGEIRTVLSWMKALSPGAVAARPWLRLYQSRALFVAGKLAQAEAILDELEAQGTGADDQLAAQLAGSRARIAAARGEVSRAIQSANQALAGLAPAAVLARSSAASSLGYALMLKGDLEASLGWMTRAHDEALANGFRLLAINALANQAWARMIQGQAALSEQLIEDGMRLGRIGGQYIPATGLVLILRAERCYERGELETSQQDVQAGLALLAQGGIEDTSLMGRILLVRLMQARNDPQGAAQAMQQALEQANHSGLERSERVAAAFQAQLWLMQDHLRPARDWAARYRSLPAVEYLHESEDLTLARVLLASGDLPAALEVCQTVRAAAEAGGRMRRVLEALLVQARVLQAYNRIDAAQSALLQSLLLGQAQGVHQVYLSEGEGLRLMLREAARRGVNLALLDRLLEGSMPATAQQPELRQPLSERELDVLRLLAEGLSNREIATRLTVAETTVKKHVNHVFDKLDVTSRTQALIRARALGLLS